jgi:hypothetical protein
MACELKFSPSYSGAYANSIFTNFTDYLSAPSLIDLFIDSKGTLHNINIQKYLNSNTYDVMGTLCELTDSSEVLDFFTINCFNDTIKLALDSLPESSLNHSSAVIGNELAVLSEYSAQVTAQLMLIFPEFSGIVDPFIFCGLEDDHSLLEKASTPDVKLYYPEPFIASPSFVH